VGAPTLTPFIRATIESETGISVETRIDPMTVVAQGAALFAAAQPIPVPAVPIVSPGSVEVELTHPPVSADVAVVVGGRIPALAGNAGAVVEVVRSDGGWTSGRVPLRDGKFVISAGLEEQRTNTFGLRAFRSDGSTVDLSPASFSVRHQDITVEQAPLSRTLSVAVEGFGEHPRAEPVIPRGTRLPAARAITLRTVRALNPGRSDEAITLYVVEGEAERADRNDHVGHLRIDGTSIRRTVPVGSEVELRLHVTESYQLEVTAFVPLLDERFPLTIPDVNRPVPDAAILEAELEVERERSEDLGDQVPVEGPAVLVAGVERALEEAAAGDEDAALRAQRLLRELQTALDAASDRARLPKLRAQWLQLLPDVTTLVSQQGTSGDQQHLRTIEEAGQKALDEDDPAALDRSLHRLGELRFRVLSRQPGFWIGWFSELANLESEMTDRAAAAVLIRKGRTARDRQDLPALSEICLRLYQLLPAARQQEVRGAIQPRVTLG
jgi:molecular chaperone DnaK